ncbi:MAG: hypothetical protein NTY48_05285 [Candidatus Diapherotrites archaeon]|nr:hypothetical protein [Candidatus Diapherotrites archaeon]
MGLFDGLQRRKAQVQQVKRFPRRLLASQARIDFVPQNRRSFTPLQQRKRFYSGGRWVVLPHAFPKTNYQRINYSQQEDLRTRYQQSPQPGRFQSSNYSAQQNTKPVYSAQQPVKPIRPLTQSRPILQIQARPFKQTPTIHMPQKYSSPRRNIVSEWLFGQNFGAANNTLKRKPNFGSRIGGTLRTSVLVGGLFRR